MAGMLENFKSVGASQLTDAQNYYQAHEKSDVFFLVQEKNVGSAILTKMLSTQ
jgi:hypothetical protein